MPWYIWLLIILALGSIIGGLLALRDTARPIPLTEEQKARIARRNAELDAQERQEKARNE